MGVKIVSYDRNALSFCFIGFCIPPGYFKMSEFFAVDLNVTKLLTYGNKEFLALIPVSTVLYVSLCEANPRRT